MADLLRFTATDAARITGVSPELALAWRRRGLWGEAEDGKHVRYSLLGLCHLKLVRALIDAGIPVGTTLDHLTSTFSDAMMNAVLAQTKPHLSTGYAIICLKGQTIARFFAFNLSDLANLGNEDAIEWDTTIIINLSSLAQEMVKFGALE